MGRTATGSRHLGARPQSGQLDPALDGLPSVMRHSCIGNCSLRYSLYQSTLLQVLSKMDIDDEPPMLVEAGEQTNAPDQLSTDMNDLNVTRVPITIITGELICFPMLYFLSPSYPFSCHAFPSLSSHDLNPFCCHVLLAYSSHLSSAQILSLYLSSRAVMSASYLHFRLIAVDTCVRNCRSLRFLSVYRVSCFLSLFIGFCFSSLTCCMRLPWSRPALMIPLNRSLTSIPRLSRSRKDDSHELHPQ